MHLPLRRKICLLILLSAIARSAPVSATELRAFRLDPARTTVQFQLRHYFGTVTGYFRDVTGTLRIDPDQPENSSVTAKCPSKTVDTANATRDRHLRTELFEVEKFPDVVFRGTKVVRTGKNTADLTGDLTLHGVTRPIVLHVTLLERTKNSAGKEISRWRATGGTFSRRAFGLQWPRAVEAVSGIGDEITLSIECEAVALD